MIERPSNWDSVQAFSDRPRLPAGAYVCRIKKAVIQSNSYGEQLAIVFDIEDGEFAGYYEADFRANQAENKKWRGVFRPFLPKNDGSEKDEWTKAHLKGLITAIENSNRGYVWNWDETTLAGRLIGLIFRNEEWEYNGKTGWTARPFRACSVDTVQDGEYTLPPDKPLKKADNPVSSGSFTPIAADDELPF